MTPVVHSIDPADRLEHFRPDLRPEASSGWDAAAMLATILADDPRPTRWRSRHRVSVAITGLLAGAAAITVVAIALPGGLPGGPDRAAAGPLERLAVVASADGNTVGPGQFSYVRERTQQTSESGEQPPTGYVLSGGMVREDLASWTSRSGDITGHRGLGTASACTRTGRGTPGPGSPEDGNYADLPVIALAKLPTRTAALARFLDEHPAGDNRGGLNRFVSVGDLVRSGLASPALRAAAIRVLASTDGITVDDHASDALKRAAIRVDYAYGDAAGTVGSLYFAPRTSRLTEQQDRSPKFLFRSVVLRSGVVDSVPTGLPTCS